MATNKAMRLGSVMLVLALLTTCAISATFAKYVTSATGNDSARVAYWGWTSDGNLAGDSTTLGLFAKTYAADDASATSDNTVVSSDNVVAPGTKSSVDVTFKYTGLLPLPMPMVLLAQTLPRQVIPIRVTPTWAMAHYGKFKGVRNYIALVDKKGATLDERWVIMANKLCCKHRSWD